MLIQAYCQQEREKRCTITAKADESRPQDAEESGVEKMDIDDPTSDPSADGTKTPKVEPNESPTPKDVEMIDTTEPIAAIKQEPEDEVTSIETDPLAEGDDDGADTKAAVGADDDGGSKDDSNAKSGASSIGGDDNSTNASKNDAQSDSQSSENQAIKMESDDNCNDSNSENNKENPSESTTCPTNTTNTDEPIKIEESTTDKDDPFSINIDPRTYCKLGHFHLLLEDYAKGK